MAASAREEGVAVDVIVGRKGRRPSDAILRTAQSVGADLIAMASAAGPVASALLGSCARAVLRGARCPVWVLHPPKRSGALPSTESAVRPRIATRS